MAPLCARVGRVNITVNDTVQRHRQASGPYGSQQNPQEVNAGGDVKLTDGDKIAHQYEGKRKQRMLDFDEGQDLLDVHHSGPPKERWGGHSYLLSSG